MLRLSVLLATAGVLVTAVPTNQPASDIETSQSKQFNHKPSFKNCLELKPSVQEDSDPGTYVTQVVASDPDPSDNGGRVTYTFVLAPGERSKFLIDPNTGVITTRYVLDRDEPEKDKEVYVTVRATDNGKPQLDDVCTMKITVEDINDNQPVFDESAYQEYVPQNLQQDREVMRISATDIDDGNNGIVHYKLESQRREDDGYFRIDQRTGVIYLNRTIDRSAGQKFNLRVYAMDQGNPPLESSINLEIVVVESNKKSPSFTSIPSSPIILPKNFQNYSYNIATLTAQSNTDEVAPVFELMVGRTEQTNKGSTFRLVTEGRSAHIRLNHRLEYESIAEYTLTIRIQNKYNLAAETSIRIQLADVNDDILKSKEARRGKVLKNESAGTPVRHARAIDADATTEHNQVNRMEIANKNDHGPKFTQAVYVVAYPVPEDANVNALVTQVKAVGDDTASPVRYSIISGNEGDAFRIEETTGKIRVKGRLDYETRTNHTLRVRAFDGDYFDEATVEIKIDNVNDCPPVFNNLPYGNINLTEETPITGCIAQFEAYDPDIPDRSKPQHIKYYVLKLEQQKFLKIDEKGCLTLIHPLDRDPPNGFEKWQVIIVAADENGGPTSLRSTAEVTITLTDINDKAPHLDRVRL